VSLFGIQGQLLVSSFKVRYARRRAQCLGLVNVCLSFDSGLVAVYNGLNLRSYLRHF